MGGEKKEKTAGRELKKNISLPAQTGMTNRLTDDKRKERKKGIGTGGKEGQRKWKREGRKERGMKKE